MFISFYCVLLFLSAGGCCWLLLAAASCCWLPYYYYYYYYDYYDYYYYYYYYLNPRQGPREVLLFFRACAGTRQKLYKTNTLEWFWAQIINPDIKFDLTNR